MIAKGWKGGSYGIRVGKANAAAYFKRDWRTVEIVVDGEFHSFPLNETFWTTCPEVRGGVLNAWFLQHGLVPWESGNPPVLSLIPIGGNRFRLSAG